MWRPTAEELLQYKPIPTGISPGFTLYTVSHISSLRSIFVYNRGDNTAAGGTHTNLHGRRRCNHWTSVDEVKMRAYTGFLILAGIYCTTRDMKQDVACGMTRQEEPYFVLQCLSTTIISANINFNDRPTCLGCFGNNKLAAFFLL